MADKIAAYRERFANNPNDDAIFRALEEHYFLDGSWESLVEIYEQRLEALGDDASRERAGLLFRFGQALEEGFGNLERARLCYRQAIEQDATLEPARRRLRQLEASNGNWDEALALLESEATQDPTPDRRVRLRIELGELCLAQASDPARAVEAFEAALVDHPNEAAALIGRARGLDALALREDAERAWTEASERLEGNSQAEVFRLWIASIPEGEPETAIAIHWRAHAARSDENQWVEGLAKYLTEAGRWDDVAALAEERVARAGSPSERAAIAIESGRTALHRLDDSRAARRWFARAAEWHESPDLHLALAEAATVLGDESLRASHLGRAMELDGEAPSLPSIQSGAPALEIDPPEEPEPEPAPSGTRGLRDRARQAPDDPAALCALGEELESAGLYEELVETLERRLALARSDSDERATLLFRIGSLRERELQDPQSAADAYQLCFTLDPQHPGVVEALSRLLGDDEHLGELIDLLRQGLGHVPARQKTPLLCALGDLELTAHEDIPAAIDAYRQALALEPACAPALAGVRRIAAEIEEPHLRLEAIACELSLADSARLDEIAPQAIALSTQLGEGDRAARIARQWARQSESREAREALVEVLSETGDTEELVDALVALEHCLEGAELAANRRRLGYLHATEGRGDLAVLAWQSALDADPNDTASAESLVDALWESGRSADLVQLFAGDLAASIRAVRGAEHKRASALESLGQKQDALDAFCRLRRDDPQDPELPRDVERLARAVDAPEILVEAIAARVAHEDDDAVCQRLELERAELLASRLDRASDAIVVFRHIANSASQDEHRDHAEERLGELLEAQGDLSAFCDHLEKRAERASGTPAADLLVRVSGIAESDLGDLPRARRNMESAVAHRPDRSELWFRLGHLYDEEAQPDDVLRALRGELDAGPAPERLLPLQLQAGRLCAASDPDAAEVFFEAVLEHDGAEPEACAFLVARYDESGRSERAFSLLRAQLDAAEGGEAKNTIRLALADRLIAEEETSTDAVAFLEQALAEAQEDTLAIASRLAPLYKMHHRDDALVTLCGSAAERAADASQASSWWSARAEALLRMGNAEEAARSFEASLEGATDPESTEVTLCELYRQTSQTRALAELLETVLERQQDADAQTPIRSELAELYEGALDDRERALDHLEALSRFEARNDEWTARAIALAASQGAAERQLALLQNAVENGTAGARPERLLAIATLLDERLERRDAAIDAYRDALRASPGRDAIRRTLRERLFDAGRVDQSLEIIESEIHRAPHDEQRALVELAIERASGTLPANALRPWVARLEAMVGDDSADLRHVADLYAEIGDDTARARALGLAAAASDDPKRAIAIQRTRVELFREQNDNARCIMAWEAIRALDPDNRDALVALDPLYETAGRTSDRRQVLEALVAAAPDANDIKLRLARLCTTALPMPERAAELWDDLLREDAVALEPELQRAVGDVLYRGRRFERWAPIAEACLQEEPAGTPRWCELRGRLAEVYHETLGRPSDALQHWRALCDAGAADERQEQALLRALLVRGAASEWMHRVEARLTSQPEDADAWLALARVREERLALFPAAAEAYRRASELDPERDGAWSGLQRVAAVLGQWPDAARALEVLIERGAVPPTPGWRTLGELHYRRLGDLDAAAHALERARELSRNDLDSLRLLREIAIAREDFQSACDLYDEEIAELGESDPASRPLWIEIARLARTALGDGLRCVAAYAAADRLEPLCSVSLDQYAEVLENEGDREGWAEIFERWCDYPDSGATACDHERLTERLRELGKADRALARIERAIEVDPHSLVAWDTAGQLRAEGGDHLGAHDAWCRAASLSTGPTAAHYYERAAAIIEDEHEDKAWDAWKHAAAADPLASVALAGVARVGEASGRLAEAADAALRLLALPPDPSDGDGVGEFAITLSAEARSSALASGMRGAEARADAGGRDREPWERAMALAGAILSENGERADALWVRGRAAFALGDFALCRTDLEARLSHPEEVPVEKRPLLLEELGLAMAGSGARSGAIDRLREALALEAERGDSHRGLCESLELTGRDDEAALAWAEWAEVSGRGREAATRFERAARLAEKVELDAARIESFWRSACDRDPDASGHRIALVEHLFAESENDEALREAQMGVARFCDGAAGAELESLRGRILERLRELPDALDAYRRSIELGSDRIDDARAAARILRGMGDWSGAASLLRNFCASCPQDSRCGEALLELGRLLAGPLEDMNGAIEAYRRARDLAPEREDVREAYADLLAQYPEQRDEAVAEHKMLLRAQPLRLRSLRALLSIAERETRRRPQRGGLALLESLGALSVYEREGERPRLDVQLTRVESDEVPELWDALRKAAKQAAPYCHELLPETPLPEERKAPVSEPLAAFRDAFIAAENEALGAAWLTLPSEALRGVLSELVRAASEDDNAATALRDAPGRVRRRVRKALAHVAVADLETLDIDAWRRAVELDVFSVAVDASGGHLRSALLFALAQTTEGASLSFSEESDISEWLEHGGIALALYERALSAWLATV